MRNTRKSSVTSKILTLLLLGLIILFSAFTAYLAYKFFQLESSVSLLSDQLSYLLSDPGTVQSDYSLYSMVVDQTTAEMDKMVSIVGIIAAVYTIFGALIVFRAPREIDRRLNQLSGLAEETGEMAKESRYLFELLRVTQLYGDWNETCFEKTKAISTVINGDPDRPEGYALRADIYYEMGEYDKALAGYKKAMSLDEGKAPRWLNKLAVTYAEKGEPKKALKYFDKAIKIRPGDSVLLGNRGKCYDDLEDFDRALADYSISLDIEPESPIVLINRSSTYMKMAIKGDREEESFSFRKLAICDLERALEIDPENKQAEELLESFNKPRDIEEIAKMYRRLGDFSFSEKEYQLAFGFYVKAALLYLPDELDEPISVDERDVVDSLVKVTERSEEMLQFEDEEEENAFSGSLCSIGVQAYLQGDPGLAETCFRLSRKCTDVNRDDATMDLAFMKRRGECVKTEESAAELLDECCSKVNGVWRTNKALLIIGEDSANVANWHEAVEGIKSAEDVDQAVDWWANEECVGTCEHNLTMMLFALADAPGLLDKVSLEERASTVMQLGVSLPLVSDLRKAVGLIEG